MVMRFLRKWRCKGDYLRGKEEGARLRIHDETCTSVINRLDEKISTTEIEFGLYESWQPANGLSQKGWAVPAAYGRTAATEGVAGGA